MESWIFSNMSARVKRGAVVEISAAAVEVVAIYDCAAVGDVSVMVEHRAAIVPVISPVIPTPAKSSEEADSKSSAEVESWAGIKDSGHGIPTRVGQNGVSVHDPWIVSGHVNNVRIRRLNDDRASLSRYLLLVVAVQLSGLLSLLAHRLDGVRHSLRIVGVCFAEGRSPGKVFVHVFENRWKLCESLYARVPVLFVDFFGKLVTLEIGVALHPAVRLDNLGWVGGSGENLCNESVGV